MYQEWDQWINGTNRVRFLLWNSFGNPSATQGWQQAVMHFGPTVDGNPVTTGDPGGSKQADLEWNVGGNYGSLSVCGYALHCGFTVNSDGSTTSTKPTNIQTGLFGQSSLGAALVQLYPTTAGDWQIGTSISGGGNIRGVNGFFGKTMTLSGLAGTGNAYLCVDSTGTPYRSTTACSN